MPSVRYYNQTAPFWDFIASMEEQAANRGQSSDNDNEQQNAWQNPWANGFPFGQYSQRSRHSHHRGPPPPPGPPGHEGPPPPLHHEGPPPPEGDHDPEAGPSHPRGPPPPFEEGPHRGPGSRRGRCGGRGGWGGRHGGLRGFPFGPGGLNNLAEMFQSQLFGGEESSKESKDKSEDFKPEVDVFDTEDRFVVHVSLPGAKKEDVAVSWDAEKSELVLGGVVYRPGDEDFLKTLALDERKVGAFERKVRLGSRANPAQVDVDAITAKMEDGVLRIDVPKLDSGYVEIKKVDIE